MKKITPILFLLILASCGGKKQPQDSSPQEPQPKIWLFTPETTYEEAKAILTESRYEYTEAEITLGDNQIKTLASDKYVIDFARTDWSMYNAIFLNDKLAELDFSRYDGQQLNQNDINNIVRHLDKEYGESRQSRDDMQHINTWSWVSNDVYIRFTSTKAVKDNDALTLVFNIGDPAQMQKQLGL